MLQVWVTHVEVTYMYMLLGKLEIWLDNPNSNLKIS